MQTKIVIPRILSVVDLITAPQNFLKLIQDLIKQKSEPRYVIDTFIDNLKIVAETNLTSQSKNQTLDSYYLSNAFKLVFNWVETKYNLRKEIKENLDYFGELFTPIVLKIDSIHFRKEVFCYYLEKPKMGNCWDFFSQLNEESQNELFWKIISENQITQKITFRNLDIKKFQNKNRKIKGYPLNLKERALKDFLYSHYQMRKGRTDFFNYVSDKLPKLSITYSALNTRIHPSMIYPQNFYMLDKEIIDGLNQNFYECKLNKDVYKLNTEDSMLFHLMLRSGDTLVNEGYFTKTEGLKSYDKDEFLTYFLNIPSLKDILPKYIITKTDKAKSAKNKSFWRYLHINLHIDKKEVKPTKTPKMKI